MHKVCEIHEFPGKTRFVMPKRPPKTNRAQGPEPVLSDERYSRLLEDVKALLESTTRSEDHQRVTNHWKLGKRIVRERLRSDVGYHNSILRDLANGAHVAKRTLQYAVKLHTSYPDGPKSPLSLSHYRVLLDNAGTRRDHYERLAVTEGLSAPALQARIARDRLDASGAATLLPRPDGSEYVYRAHIEQVIDGDTLDLRIDVGFHMSNNARFRLANIDCPELPSTAARHARDFAYTRLVAAKTIVVQTHRTDLYGRYVAHLFYSPDDVPTLACFNTGTHLNAELLHAGHAVLMV